MSIPRILATVLIIGLLSGCYAEGNSHFLASSEIEKFASLGACEAKASSRHTDGTPRYSGYICRSKILGLTLEERRYSDGKLEGAPR